MIFEGSEFKASYSLLLCFVLGGLQPSGTWHAAPGSHNVCHVVGPDQTERHYWVNVCFLASL